MVDGESLYYPNTCMPSLVGNGTARGLGVGGLAPTETKDLRNF